MDCRRWYSRRATTGAPGVFGGDRGATGGACGRAQVLPHGGFLAAQEAAVNFDLFFTLAALLHAALLAREVRPLASQARQIVVDLRQFDL